MSSTIPQTLLFSRDPESSTAKRPSTSSSISVGLPSSTGAAMQQSQGRRSSADSRDTQPYQYSHSQGRISEYGGARTSTDYRDSLPVSQNGGPLKPVSEHSKRASNTLTFGPGEADPASSSSRGNSFSVDRRRVSSPRSLAPPAFSNSASDALRRQSLRSGGPSRDEFGDVTSDKEGGGGYPPEKKEDIPFRPSEDGVGGVAGNRSNSFHRLTLKTTNDSSTGYPGYTSSNGHGDWKKVSINQAHIPRSSYYVGPPAVGSAFGTDPMGEIGVHFPREIVRVERDYSGGELVQLYPTYPLEFEGRVTPTQFQASINEINEILISAYSLRSSAFENILGVMTLYLSTLILETHYEKEMRRLARLFDRLNREIFNPAGLNLVWPRKSAFLFLDIEYYVSNRFTAEHVIACLIDD
ncbi:hypothetical protein FRB94_005910 [Tulasnella sp. JGI-2019a]|nr:hypothetical protein FRB93_006152 [Tulasnella sp. JGI-2019a]KAG8999822.1 hypothetical protein FRB94_005910 [Tulasnella sp. JGI-2019a]